MKKVILALLVALHVSAVAYAEDFLDTDVLTAIDVSTDPDEQKFQTWVERTAQIDTIVIANSAVVLNTAKLTNATHTGDVTGSGALTIAVDAVDIPMLSATGTASSSTFLRGDNTWTTPSGSGDMTAAVYDAAGITEQVVGLTATQTLTNKTIANSGFGLNSDETNLMWDGSDSYKVHLDGIFEPKDATILKDADIGSTVASDAADVNLWEDTLTDLTTAEADIQAFRVPTDVEWTAVYSECDDTSDVRLQPYISATRFGTYAAVTGSAPFDPTAAAPDMSGWTDLTAGDYVKLVITTPNTGAATECHTSFNLVNN